MSELKASDLRIGNLLMDSVSKAHLRVIELTEHCVTTYVIDRSLFPLNPGWKHKPIPLSEEWLLKFGFERDECVTYRWYYTTCNYPTITIDIDDHCVQLGNDFWLDAFGTKLQYVHQLQNLFYCLCGEELTLNKHHE